MSQKLESLNRIGGLRGIETPQSKTPQTIKGDTGFKELLNSQMDEALTKSTPAAVPSGLKFSAHAVERLRSRGITFDSETLKRLDQAVDKAAEKGSKESLVLTDDSALIVSIKNKTVITAMDRMSMKENVFTNIDSTILI